MMKKVILFDLDDTLFDRNEYIRKTYNYLCDNIIEYSLLRLNMIKSCRKK